MELNYAIGNGTSNEINNVTNVGSLIIYQLLFSDDLSCHQHYIMMNYVTVLWHSKMNVQQLQYK